MMLRYVRIFSFILLVNLLLPVRGYGATIPLVINELMASNSRSIQDPQGQYEDWIEIYNYGTQGVNISGMYLTDDLSNPTKWRIIGGGRSGTVVPAGGYLLVWADDDLGDTGLHATFKLDAEGEEIGLFDSDGVTLIDRVVFPEQTPDVSYGRFPDAEDTWRFFTSASPEAQNDGAYAGHIAQVQFSHHRGFYDTPFEVTLATETEGAIIYYTLDGSEPYSSSGRFVSGSVYTGPIPINGTTCLRARAVRHGDYKPTDVGTHTYIFLDDTITKSQQQVLADGYPSTWFGDYPADYEMDPQVYNNSAYAGLMDDAMLSIPTLSVVTDKDNLFSQKKNSETGGVYIYTGHSSTGGQDWERAVSAEFFTPNGEKEFQVDCGLRIQGGESRNPAKCPKHSLSLRFSEDYGPAKLDFPLFDAWPIDSFDSIQLRGFFNNAWTHWSPAQRQRTQYIRDQWMRDSLIDMGQVDAGQGIYVHLYLNGIYWGLYNLQERPVASHYAAYNGGEKDNLDAINGGRATDGTTTEWNQLRSVVIRRDWKEICRLMDMDNFIDWTLLNLFAGNVDLKDSGNWRAAGGGSEQSPWHFYSWDGEHVLESVSQTGTSPSSDPTNLLSYLDDIEEFRVRFGDRVHKHLFNGGALTPEANAQRWTRRADEIDLAVIAESARWGDYRRDVHSYSSAPYYLYTKNGYWIPEQRRLLDQYFPYRTNNALNQFKNLGFYPNVDAPVFRINGSHQQGGWISKNHQLTMTGTTGTIWYTLDGSDPRQTEASSSGDSASTTLIAESAAKRVLVPTQAISDTWKSDAGLDDSSWLLCSGLPGGVGFERSSGYESYISLDLQEQMYARNATCYIRIPFYFGGNPNGFNLMMLKARYDDGFIAYLNGTEVAKEHFGGTPRWNSSASSTHSDSEAVVFQSIDISSHIGALRQGANVLAIHGLNASTTSSDFLISVELIATQGASAGSEDLSLGAKQYSGSVTLPYSANVKARAFSGRTWSALNDAIFAVGPVAENLRITEIMYHPQALTDVGEPNEEFIELANIGTETINLNLVRFTNGIDFTFPNLDLAPGEYVVVVQEREVFEAAYGRNITIVGQYTGRLNNAGERITLEDALGQTILDFSYRDNWRSLTDGEGFSLTIIDPTNPDLDSWNQKDAWRAGAYIGGSPGQDDSGILPNPGAVVINELLANSPAGDPDWIELYNTTTTAIDLGGWFLSDSNDNLFKYEIAQGTTLSPNGYLVLFADVHFSNTNETGCHEPFGLSNNGERVILSAAQNGVLMGYREIEDFGASAPGVSFGRYDKSSTGNTNFVAMEISTPGSENAYPLVGPIVISEIMYNPDWPDNGSFTNDQYEYVELHNISAESVTLYDFDNGVPWAFTRGIDFTFPTDVPVTIPAGGYLLVVKYPEAFLWRYPGVPDEKVLGPYDGKLGDAGESLELSMPGDVDDEGEPYYIRIDRINYSDGSHPEDCPGHVDLWPTEPDGADLSLIRKVFADYGNDPDNWMAATPSPGR
ncbi:MAG: lamin tail domain-containing protein [Sedimentisphaerales bacterium]|nr:lamin tail domain-containing protein [Sedimentisphaerales bacterium]